MVISQAVPGGSNNPGWAQREDNGTVRKSGLSCAECRRSKLKCDRVFPCQSCIRRGCAAICPDGALSATKGNKVLVARVERLQGQVKNMSSRIKELEAALADSQAHAGKQQHPLLAGGVKWEEAEDAGLPPESDTDSVVGAPYDDNDEEYSQQVQGEQEMASLDMQHLGLPNEICNLATAFPLGVSDRPNLHLYFLQFIPRRERALELSKLYYQFSSWMYKPVSASDFDDLLQTLYTPSSTPDAPKAHAHSLAVFFMIMCIGSLFDAVHPDHELHTERYHALARAALSSHSIVHQRSCTTVQALFLLNLYKYIIPRPSPEYRWLMSGICARLAQAMGLQRDCSGWGFNSEEVQRRRTVFWELFVFETWTSLLSGRPSLLNLRQINCRFPEDREPVTYQGEVEIGFHSWLFRFAAGCMSLAVQHVFSSRKPTYAMLTELDTKIRRFPVPRYLRCPMESISTPWSDDPAIAMQQFCAYGHVEHTILYLHRSHFAQIRGEPMQETVGRSVWSIYRSSARLIRALTSLYSYHPDMTSKMWYFWSAYYSASIAIGALVLDRPWCQLSPHALLVVSKALEVYERGSKTCSIPSTLRILQNLVERSHAAYRDHQHNGSSKKCNADCCPNISPDDVRRFAEGDDELIPGQALEKSPDTRYASASPPSTGNGEPFIDNNKSSASNSAPVSMHSQVVPTMPSPPIHTPPPPSSSVPDAQTAYPNYVQFMPSSIGMGHPAPGPFTYTPQVEEPWFYTPASAHAAFAMDYSPSSAEAFDGLNPWNARKADGIHASPHQHMPPQPYRVPSMHGPPQGSHPLSNMTPYHPASSSQTSLHASHVPGDGQQSMWHNYVPQHHQPPRMPSQWG